MPYELEKARSGRSSCKDKHCKTGNILIAKGEWRLGSITTGGDFQRTFYKHIQHVTARQVSNIEAELGSLQAFIASQQAAGTVNESEAPVLLRLLQAIRDDEPEDIKVALIELKDLGAVVSDLPDFNQPKAKTAGGNGVKADHEEDTKAQAKAAVKQRKRKVKTEDHEEDIKPSAHDITPVKTELDGVKNEQPNEQEEETAPKKNNKKKAASSKKRKVDGSDTAHASKTKQAVKPPTLETQVVDAVKAIGRATADGIHERLSSIKGYKEKSVKAAITRCVTKGFIKSDEAEGGPFYTVEEAAQPVPEEEMH